jgi:hypothetical protein
MTWVKKTGNEEDRKFWSHVETVAERVRGSELHSNYRVRQNPTRSRNGAVDDSEGRQASDRQTKTT